MIGSNLLNKFIIDSLLHSVGQTNNRPMYNLPMPQVEVPELGFFNDDDKLGWNVGTALRDKTLNNPNPDLVEQIHKFMSGRPVLTSPNYMKNYKQYLDFNDYRRDFRENQRANELDRQ